MYSQGCKYGSIECLFVNKKYQNSEVENREFWRRKELLRRCGQHLRIAVLVCSSENRRKIGWYFGLFVW